MNIKDDLKFPACPNCGSRDVDVLWATCKTGRIHTVRRAMTWPGGIEYAHSDLKDGHNGLLIQYGFQCAKCERHWFELPVHRMDAIREFCETVTEFAKVPTRQEYEGIGSPPEAPDYPGMNKLTLLTVFFDNDEPLHYIFTDEYMANQKLVEIVTEWSDENNYPRTQALLDQGKGMEAVAMYFANEVDPSKRYYRIDIIDGVGEGENKVSGCSECEYRGWIVVNEDCHGSPLGLIQQCDNCQHNDPRSDDATSMAKAVLAGYRTIWWEGQHIVVARPEDKVCQVAQCKCCNTPNRINEMTCVKVPRSEDSYYCSACFQGINASEVR